MWLNELFDDYCNSSENWFESNLYLSSVRTHSTKNRGRHVLTPYKDLKTKFGAQQALTIYQEKKQLELNKGPKDEVIYFMKHPDCKSEDRGHMQKTFATHCTWFQVTVLFGMVCGESSQLQNICGCKTTCNCKTDTLIYLAIYYVFVVLPCRIGIWCVCGTALKLKLKMLTNFR